MNALHPLLNRLWTHAVLSFLQSVVWVPKLYSRMSIFNTSAGYTGYTGYIQTPIIPTPSPHFAFQLTCYLYQSLFRCRSWKIVHSYGVMTGSSWCIFLWAITARFAHKNDEVLRFESTSDGSNAGVGKIRPADVLAPARRPKCEVYLIPYLLNFNLDKFAGN